MNFFKTIFLSLLFFDVGNAYGFDHTHEQLTKILSTNVDQGFVNYTALKSDPAPLVKYLASLAVLQQAEFEKFSRKEQLAYFINLYNASTLKLIINNYPVKSIKDIGSYFKGPWKQSVVDLFGQKVTLDHIEHDILRASYAEPRIHFALVCAAKGCPPLRNEAYRSSDIDSQLDDQGKVFLASKQKNNFDRSLNTFTLSPIFKWFIKDFGGSTTSVLQFISKYLEVMEQKAIALKAPIIQYSDYDWSLNER